MLPLYFAVSGLQTDITQIDSIHMVIMVLFVLVMSTLGKYLGCGIPAWLCGLSFRNTAMISILMNTRGIFELIVLNVGVKAGIISTRVFTIMVLMTLITTFTASPLIDYLYPTREHKHSPALGSLEEEEEGEGEEFHISECSIVKQDMIIQHKTNHNTSSKWNNQTK